MILMATSCHIFVVGMTLLLQLVYVKLHRATGNTMSHEACASQKYDLDSISSIIIIIETVYEENMPRHFQYTCSRSFSAHVGSICSRYISLAKCERSNGTEV